MKKFENHKAKKENYQERQNIVLHAASEWYNDLIETYFEECIKISANEKNNKYSFDNVALDGNDYSSRCKELNDETPTFRTEGHK